MSEIKQTKMCMQLTFIEIHWSRCQRPFRKYQKMHNKTDIINHFYANVITYRSIDSPEKEGGKINYYE